jgi:hypothetical protein
METSVFISSSTRGKGSPPKLVRRVQASGVILRTVDVLYT